MTPTIKTLLAAGQTAALAALLGSTALAQTSDTETVLVPEPALEANSSIGIISEAAPRTLEQMDNDQTIADTLILQGFTDIHILREGPMMTVTAQRDGQPIELVYSVANGTLVSIDGQELREPSEGSSANDVQAAGDGASDADARDGAGDEGDGDMSGGETGDDGAADGGGSDADGSDTDSGGTDGGESDGGDAGSGDGSDGGSDGADSGGSDGGSDAGGDSDGGSDG